MEFLARIRVLWPPDGDPAERDALIAAERIRVGELIANGKLMRLWRLPGRWENVTLWQVVDASEFDRLLRSLPFFPWLDVVVEALAEHPSDPKVEEGTDNQ